MLFYISPQRWEGEQREGNPDRAQRQQPAGFPGPPWPGPQSPESHKGGSVQAVPTAHTRAACLPPPASSWAWQLHWVTQPQAGDNDHTVGSHTSTTAERLRIIHQGITSTHSLEQPLPPLCPAHPEALPTPPCDSGQGVSFPGFPCVPCPQHTPESICTVHHTFPASPRLS